MTESADSPDRSTPSVATGSGERPAPGTENVLDGVLLQLQMIERQLDSLQTNRTVVGESGEAQENRAIRVAGARAAVQRSRELRQHLHQICDDLTNTTERLHDHHVHVSGAEQDSAGEDRHVRDRRIIGALTASARDLSVQSDATLTSTLEQIVTGALSAIDHVRYASVATREGRASLGPLAASDPRVADGIRRQAECSSGPCLQAMVTGTVVAARSTEEIRRRWPAVAPHFESLGVQSLLSLPLVGDDGRSSGVLGLLADGDEVLDDTAELIAELLADQAAHALLAAGRVRGLETALRTRDIIGQAKGVLMARHHIDAERAFAMLVKTSKDTNVKLTDLARFVATTLTEPESDGSS